MGDGGRNICGVFSFQSYGISLRLYGYHAVGHFLAAEYAYALLAMLIMERDLGRVVKFCNCHASDVHNVMLR